MTLERDLEPKLATITDLARKRFAHDLKQHEGLELTDDDRIVPTDFGPFGDEQIARVPDAELAWSILQSDLGSLRTRFQSYYRYHPDALSTLRSRLTPTDVPTLGVPEPDGDTDPSNAYSRLDYAYQAYLGPAGRLFGVDTWSGPAADAFEAFLGKLSRASELQRGYVLELAAVLDLYRQALTDLAGDVLKIADSCIMLLPPDPGQSKLDAVLNTMSIANDLVGFIPGPTSMGSGLLGLGLDVFSLYRGKHEKQQTRPQAPWPIGGGSATEILTSAWGALTEVETSVANLDVVIYQILNADLENTHSLKAPELSPPRPTIADAGPTALAGENNFPSNPNRGSPSQHPLVASLAHLYHMGIYDLPGAAAEYRAADTFVQSCALDVNLAGLFPYSPGAFNEARLRLDGILSDFGSNLVDTGKTLVMVARTYQLTDEEHRELIAQTATIHPPRPR